MTNISNLYWDPYTLITHSSNPKPRGMGYEGVNCIVLFFIVPTFHCFFYPYCPKCLDALLSFHTLLLSWLVLVLNTVTLLSCTTIVVHPIVLCRTIGLTCISSVSCTPWSISSLLTTGVPDVLHSALAWLTYCALTLTSAACEYTPLCCSSGDVSVTVDQWHGDSLWLVCLWLVMALASANWCQSQKPEQWLPKSKARAIGHSRPPLWPGLAQPLVAGFGWLLAYKPRPVNHQMLPNTLR